MSEPRHIHASEINWIGPHYNVRLDGAPVDAVVEVMEGPEGFAFIDVSYYSLAFQGWDNDADWEKDESDPGPAWILFGNVTLEPIP